MDTPQTITHPWLFAIGQLVLQKTSVATAAAATRLGATCMPLPCVVVARAYAEDNHGSALYYYVRLTDSEAVIKRQECELIALPDAPA